jgi:transposase-like protein
MKSSTNKLYSLLSEEELRSAALNLIATGYTLTDTARVLGLSFSTVAHWVKEPFGHWDTLRTRSKELPAVESFFESMSVDI